jgi:hypothetical protein
MKKLRIILICISLFSVFCLTRSACAGFEGDVYRGSYECRDTAGRKRWQATAEIRNKEGNIYVITEKLDGRYYGFKGPISWLAREEFERTGDTVRPIGMDQRIFDQSGKMIAVRRQTFDFTKKVVTCTYDDLTKNTSVTKKFIFNEEVINRLLQGLYVQKFLENGETSKDVQFITLDPALYYLELRVVAKEEIEISGQKRKAYKILFDPQFGIFNPAKVFLPKAVVWHSAEPPFELLKYKGIETSISSPEVEIITLESCFIKQTDPKRGF